MVVIVAVVAVAVVAVVVSHFTFVQNLWSDLLFGVLLKALTSSNWGVQVSINGR